MASTRPLDVPPYQVQNLISNVVDPGGFGFDPSQVHVKCAQAFGSEIYVGCTNGDLLRFALVADHPDKPATYLLLSRQTLPSRKPIDEIVLVPCVARAFVLSDRTLSFYHLPTLEPVSLNTIKPIRHVAFFAIDYYALQRPALSLEPGVSLNHTDPVDFCVIKRTSIAMYVMRERLSYLKEIPLPTGVSHARRIGDTLLTADAENYNLISLSEVQLIPIIPLSQAPLVDPNTGEPLLDKNGEWLKVKPIIEVVGVEEFLILSSTGAAGTMGLFITTGGDPVRGTLQWPEHPGSVCLDYPYITALLSNDTIQIHNIDSQEIVQIINAPPPLPSPPPLPPSKSLQPRAQPQAQQQPKEPQRQRRALVPSLGGYHVPSTQRSGKLGMVKVSLLRGGGLKELEEKTKAARSLPAEEAAPIGGRELKEPDLKPKEANENENETEEREVERNLLLPELPPKDHQVERDLDLSELPQKGHSVEQQEQPPVPDHHREAERNSDLPELPPKGHSIEQEEQQPVQDPPREVERNSVLPELPPKDHPTHKEEHHPVPPAGLPSKDHQEEVVEIPGLSPKDHPGEQQEQQPEQDIQQTSELHKPEAAHDAEQVLGSSEPPPRDHQGEEERNLVLPEPSANDYHTEQEQEQPEQDVQRTSGPHEPEHAHHAEQVPDRQPNTEEPDPTTLSHSHPNTELVESQAIENVDSEVISEPADEPTPHPPRSHALENVGAEDVSGPAHDQSLVHEAEDFNEERQDVAAIAEAPSHVDFDTGSVSDHEEAISGAGEDENLLSEEEGTNGQQAKHEDHPVEDVKVIGEDVQNGELQEHEGEEEEDEDFVYEAEPTGQEDINNEHQKEEEEEEDDEDEEFVYGDNADDAEEEDEEEEEFVYGEH